MLKAIVILGFRADVGSYLIDKYPESFDAEAIDAMNIYNLHRFRTTKRNFQAIKQHGRNIASYYSGFKNTNYIGKPDHVVALILDEEENANDYEKVLVKVTNNLLALLGSDDFDYEIMNIYTLLDQKDFDGIKVAKGTANLEEEAVEKKKIATTSSASLSDEEKIFADLMDSEDLGVEDGAFDSKMNDFEKSFSTEDPFAGGAADPFGGGGTKSASEDSRDIYAENPFDSAQKPSFEKAMGLDEAVGKTMFQKKKTTAANIVQRLDSLEAKKPQKPAESDKESKYKYLEALLGFLDEKVKVLGELAKQVKDLQNADQEKDQLIGKLLLLLDKK